jgi:spermidine synthase
MGPLLLVSVLVVATCGLVYELVAGTAASYLLGDSVTQFSTVIGAYLAAMGIGSYLSRWVGRGLLARFIQIEALVGVVGGFSAPLLFVAFGRAPGAAFLPLLYGIVGVIGTLVGLEIPLLLRILKDRYEFRDLVARVLTFDYLGALVASVAFPLVLLPGLGLVRASLAMGLLNVAVALGCALLFRAELPALRFRVAECVAAALLLAAGFAGAERLTALAEDEMYADPVVLARSSPYQRIVLTRRGDDLRLFLNGHLQFSSRDEYRYHEALVHPGMASVSAPVRRVLVLGGGDGLAVREILRDPGVQEVVLVDLDPEMTRLFRDRDDLAALNDGALRSPRVRIVNADAFTWLREPAGAKDSYDFAVVDFPDPSNHSLGKLYTTTFYRALAARLAPGGAFVVQATSPLFARRSFWCVVRTLEAAGLHALPYHAYVPSFGEWGFVLAAARPLAAPARVREGLRFLDAATLPGLFAFPPDMGPPPPDAAPEVNRLTTQALVRYYEDDWARM